MRRLLTAIILLTLFTSYSCKEAPKILFDDNGAEQSMYNAEIIHTDSGNLQMVTYGKEILFYDDSLQTQFFPKGARSTFYDEFGKINIVITADTAYNYNAKELMNLKNNVVIVNYSQGSTTYTDDFWWNQQTHRIWSDKNVLQVKKNGDRIRGIGFESDEDMEPFIIKNASFVFTIDE